MLSLEEQIFAQASSTFYPSSLEFPEPLRTEVFRLYSFVRTADDYVDEQPARPEKLAELRAAWHGTASSDERIARVSANMRDLVARYDMDPAWVDTFLDTMASDLSFSPPQTLNDALTYVYGSAEVVGMMMARLMDLPDEALETARLQGRAFQWVNFIRDIDEDYAMGRCYFPREDLEKFGLADLSPKTQGRYRDSYIKFIRYQVDRYKKWQTAAEAGYGYVPEAARQVIQRANDGYASILGIRN